MKRLLNNGMLATAAAIIMLVLILVLNYLSLKSAAIITLCIYCALYGIYTVIGACAELEYLYARVNKDARRAKKRHLCIFGAFTALLGIICLIAVCVMYL